MQGEEGRGKEGKREAGKDERGQKLSLAIVRPKDARAGEAERGGLHSLPPKEYGIQEKPLWITNATTRARVKFDKVDLRAL